MTQITLYTHERPGAGLTSTDVCNVRGAVALRIVTEGAIREIPIREHRRPLMVTADQTARPARGIADLLLETSEQQIDIANCTGAVALALTEGMDGRTTVYWFEGGRCVSIAERVAAARSDIEARCCPPEYELPPQRR